MENLILYGGSFNPIHVGHLKIAKIASDALNADVIFLPTKSPIWKDDCIDIKHRVNMLLLALRDFNCPRFKYSLFEAESEDLVYTYQTVRHFKELNKQKQIYLLIGEDQVTKFHLWKNAEEISKMCQIVFFNRDELNEINENEIKFNIKRIEYNKWYHISSTEIRNITNLETTIGVINYMIDNSLYKFNELAYLYNNERYAHARSVANLAYNIAKKHNIENPGRYFLAGILHDVAKNVDKNTLKKLMVEHYKKEYEMLPGFSYHQFIGEYFAKNIFKINDEEILNAIKYHATGKGNMSTMGKIIYASDKIDPTRGFDSKDLIDAMMNDIDSGFVTVLKANKEYLLSKNQDIENPLTKECFDYYL